MKQMQRASLPRVQRKICETNCRSNGILVRTVARILWYHENLDAMYAFKSLDPRGALTAEAYQAD